MTRIPASFSSIATVALLLTASPLLAQYTVTSGSFESWNSATGGNTPIDFPYPEVSNWTYGGTPLTNGLLGAIDENAASVPDTLHGNNWILLDSREGTQHVYQAVGTITLGDPLTLSALFGSHLTVGLSDFELALYRSNAGGSVPATKLTSITRSHENLVGLSANATATASTSYTAVAADAGQTLFVRIGLLSSVPSASGVTQTYIDNITVGPDNTAPVIAQLTPPDNGITLPDATLVATFNKSVIRGTGSITLKRSSNNATVETFDAATSSRISFSGSVVTIDPTADLDDETDYYIEIPATAIKDASNNFFAGIAGSAAWNFTSKTPGVGGTIASGSGNLSLDIDNGGVIRSISLGGGGGAAFQRVSLGESRFANTTTSDVDVQPLDDGLRVVRQIQGTGGNQATVTETFGPGLENDSISWEMVIESASAPWSTSLQTYFQLSPSAGDLRFWTSWHRNDLPLLNGYRNPLVSMPFGALSLTYGSTFSVPIASWLNEGNDRALSLVQSPFDFVQDMQMSTDATGAVNLQRTNLRIGGGNTIRFRMQLVTHAADWRAGMGFMTRHYPTAFHPHNPEAHAIGGGATYADYRGETLDAARYKQMGLTMNWNARFPWPYLSMSMPPVQSDTEQWMSFYWAGNRDSTPQSAQLMNNVAQTFRQQGFHQLEYFNLTEVGTGIVSPAPARKAVNDADLWKDSNDFIYYQIPNANLGTYAWNGARQVDPGDPAWQADLLRQATAISERLPSGSGICIDRLDRLANYNPNPGADDGVTWTGTAKRSLVYSWHDIMDKMLPITKARNKVVFVNAHAFRRADILRHSDGFYSEVRGTNVHNLLAFVGAMKPVVIWNSPGQNHTEFQEGLYLGFHHSIPFPKADHNTLPNAALETWFLNYGPLYNAMRGRKSVFLPHIVEVTSANALANIFEVRSGYVVPVVFGGTATTATVKLGALPIEQLHSVEVLHPGVANPTIITPTPQGNGMELSVPLVNGCAMVRLIADKTSNASPAKPALNFRILPEGSSNLEWNGSEALTYFVQESSNLADWTYLPVIKTGSDALLSYDTALDPNASRGFFRLATFGGPTSNAYVDDFDNDGTGNWTEIISGTDPLNAVEN